MRIAAVHAHCIGCELSAPFESATGRFDRRQHCLVEVVCDDGTTGWGECLGSASLNAAVLGYYGKHLVGKDPLATEVRWLELYDVLRDHGQPGIALTALSGIDIALWDIKGKHFAAPVWVLLGGRFRDRIQAYATGGFRIPNQDRIASVKDEVRRYIQSGFRMVKLKIGFGVAEDLDVIRAARDTVGPGIELMVDANHGFDTTEAIQLGRAMARYNIGWFEEPVAPEDLQGYAQVRKGQPVPIAGGETWHSNADLWRAMRTGAVDILQPDVCGCGGFTGMQKVAALASTSGVRIQPHVWGSGVALAASVQCLAALRPSARRWSPRAPMLECDSTPDPSRQAVLVEPLEPQGGWIDVPAKAGLGIAVNRGALEKFAIQSAEP